MKSLKNAFFKNVMAATCLLSGISITAMQQEQPQISATVIQPWYAEALKLKISNPLRVRTINNTGSLVRTMQQGQAKDYWYANIANGFSFEDTAFNMDAWTKDFPQYFFLTNKNIYTLNFEKKETYFKAILEKLAMRLKPGSINNISLQDLVKFARIVEKDEVQTPLEPVEKGDTLVIKLYEDSATMELSND